MFNLPTVHKESAIHIRNLIDTVHQHKSALEKLKLPVQHWDTLLIQVILNKLDERTNREWEIKQSHNDFPSLDNLIEFLTTKCFALEAVNRDFQKFAISKREKHEEKSQNFPLKKHSYLLNQFEEKLHEQTQLRCFICQENDHLIYRCPKFLNLTVQEKYDKIKKHKLCSNCLRAGHLKQNCFSSGCKRCNRKHNTTLHLEKTNLQRYTGTNGAGGNSAKPDSPAEREIAACAIETGTKTMPADLNLARQDWRNNTVSRKRTLHNNEPFETDANPLTLSCSSINKNQVLLSSATILIADRDGVWQKCKALLPR